MVISRRAVVNGIGLSGTLGAMAAALPAQLRAAAAAAPAPAAAAAPTTTYCITRIYQQAEGATFEGDIFKNTHVPNMIKAYGKSAERIELRLPAPVAVGKPAPQIIATVNIWFRDLQGFLQKHKTAGTELAAGMERITKVIPVEQVDEVLASLGEDRSTVPLDSFCYSIYFPFKEGGTVDTAYFAQTFYPKVAQTYGTEAIRRIEVTKAATAKPVVMASTHIYIKDELAYDAAATKSPELFAELKNYTNIGPIQTLSKVHAFG